MKIKVIAAHWQDDKDMLGDVRRRVFIEEQGVPEDLEWDEFDQDSYHVLALDENHSPVGCGRLKKDGQIGRMAVDKVYRNRGIGTAILENILQHAKATGISRIYLHAQCSAIPFYENNGFEVCSDEFLDAGIPHRTMQLQKD